MMNVAYINVCTETEGPYKRLAIWFQGCNKRCKDCCNKELQSLKVANLLTVDQILEIIKESKINNGIEGVTFLGGEPTIQNDLPELAIKIKELDLGVILFTGYTMSQFSYEYLNCFDLIVDGEFDYSKLDLTRNMIGSKNQNINLISNRYINDLNWFYEERSNEIEINLNDFLYMNGDVF